MHVAINTPNCDFKFPSLSVGSFSKMYKLIKFFCAPYMWIMGWRHRRQSHRQSGRWDNHALSEQNYYLELNKFCYK